MKIDINHAMKIATAAIERAHVEIGGEVALFKAVNDYVIAAFAELTPWMITGRSINGAQRWIIRDRFTGKYLCRRGCKTPLRYHSKTTAQAMCDRLNKSSLRNG